VHGGIGMLLLICWRATTTNTHTHYFTIRRAHIYLNPPLNISAHHKTIHTHSPPHRHHHYTAAFILFTLVFHYWPERDEDINIPFSHFGGVQLYASFSGDLRRRRADYVVTVIGRVHAALLYCCFSSCG
jgi:hypothetical protein